MIGGPGEPGPPRASRGHAAGGRRVEAGESVALAHLLEPGYNMRLPLKFLPRQFRIRSCEWIFEEIEAYHGGTSRVGRDAGRRNTGLVPLDDWLKHRYDPRLSRKRDSEQI